MPRAARARSRWIPLPVTLIGVLAMTGTTPATAAPLPPAAAGSEFEVMETTIADVHAAFDAGTLTCRGLVETYLARIAVYDQRGDTPVNSIVAVNEAALETADALDAEFAAAGSTDALRPLHCVPVMVKDNYDTADMPTTAGSLALKDSVPLQDATFVARLREDGAIVLAKTTMAEFAWSANHTISSLTGETRNPYNLGHTTAGSSGGTAASVAANFGLVGLGTDTGNSVRGPSSHNALVGMRSTFGLTSRAGVVPLFLDRDIAGPMTRTVEDNARIFSSVAGYDPRDPVTEAAVEHVHEDYTEFLDAEALDGAVLGLWSQITYTESSDPEVEALMDQAVADLEAAGATVVDFSIDDLDTVRSGLGCNRFRYDMDNYLASLGPDAPYANTEELVASGLYHSSIAENMQASLEYTGDPESPEGYCGEALERRKAYRDLTVATMDALDVDALIFPTWANKPREIGGDTPTGNNSGNTAPQMGVPALTVPMGYTSGNLPAGLQFLGREFSEPLLYGLGYAYEQATQHRVAPAGFPALELPAPAPEFVDVVPGQHFYTEIRWLAESGLTTGTTVGDDVFYYPSSNVSRQALAAFIYRYAGADYTPGADQQTFSDVRPGDPFYTEIEWMAAQGLATGYDDRSFGPARSVSRQAMAAFLHRLAGSPEAVGATAFLDVPAGHQFADPIAWLEDAGIAEGYDDGSFGPTRPITRQAIAAFLHRYDTFMVRAAVVASAATSATD